MKSYNINLSPFFIAIPLSIILHITVIAGMADIRGFPLIAPAPDTIIMTTLISGASHSTSTPTLVKDTLPDISVKEIVEEPFKGLKIENLLDTMHSVERGPINNPIPAKSNEALNQFENSDNKQGTKINDKLTSGSEAQIRGQKTLQQIKFPTERLNFDLHWVGIYVGKATLEVVNSKGTVMITSNAHSAPFISAFYKVEDYSESRIIDGMPANFRIKQHEGKYRSNKETIFDINNKKVTYYNYLKDTKDEYVINTHQLWDIVSAFYYLRSLALEVGKTVYIDVFDSSKFITVEVNVLRKEKIESFDKKKIDTVIIKPIIKTEGLFKKTGDILIWLTDDESKIPVRVETVVPVGKVVATLKGLERDVKDF